MRENRKSKIEKYKTQKICVTTYPKIVYELYRYNLINKSINSRS